MSHFVFRVLALFICLFETAANLKWVQTSTTNKKKSFSIYHEHCVLFDIILLTILCTTESYSIKWRVLIVCSLQVASQCILREKKRLEGAIDKILGKFTGVKKCMETTLLNLRLVQVWWSGIHDEDIYCFQSWIYSMIFCPTDSLQSHTFPREQLWNFTTNEGIKQCEGLKDKLVNPTLIFHDIMHC